MQNIENGTIFDMSDSDDVSDMLANNADIAYGLESDESVENKKDGEETGDCGESIPMDIDESENIVSEEVEEENENKEEEKEEEDEKEDEEEEEDEKEDEEESSTPTDQSQTPTPEIISSASITWDVTNSRLKDSSTCGDSDPLLIFEKHHAMIFQNMEANVSFVNAVNRAETADIIEPVKIKKGYYSFPSAVTTDSIKIDEVASACILQTTENDFLLSVNGYHSFSSAYKGAFSIRGNGNLSSAMTILTNDVGLKILLNPTNIISKSEHPLSSKPICAFETKTDENEGEIWVSAVLNKGDVVVCSPNTMFMVDSGHCDFKVKITSLMKEPSIFKVENNSQADDKVLFSRIFDMFAACQTGIIKSSAFGVSGSDKYSSYLNDEYILKLLRAMENLSSIVIKKQITSTIPDHWRFKSKKKPQVFFSSFFPSYFFFF